MYFVPLNIIKLLNGEDVADEKILYQNENFLLIVDNKNNKKCYHYTAWYKHNIPSLEYANHIVLMHIKDLKKELIYHKIINSNTKIYVHNPPNYYRLHVHFTCPLKIHSNLKDVYDIKRIEKYLDNKFISKL